MRSHCSSWYDEILEIDPEHLAGSDSWVGHIPFAFFLMANLAPRSLVELGVFAGNSLFAFAQAAHRRGLATRIVGVDTWASDPHSGGYDGEQVYQWVCAQQARYPDIVELRRSTFDEVRPEFSPGSVDLLHIDGYHHYDAVSHDFTSWFDTLSSQGVVLFHDTSVQRDDFGVWRFWGEIRQQFGAEATLEFPHSNGLGVLFLGKADDYPEPLRQLREAYAADPLGVQRFFSLAGARIVERFAHLQTQRVAAEQVHALQREQAALEGKISGLESELRHSRAQLSRVLSSRSWRLTAPLRVLRRGMKG